MRYENGYGSVSLIDKNSKRRKPYVVKIHVGYTGEIGKRHAKRKTIGYAKTRAEGRKMLEEYHNNPYDTNLGCATWKYVYEEWLKYKKGTGISKSGLDHYTNSYNKTKVLNNISFKNISLNMYQDIINSSKVGHDGQKRLRNLYHQLYEYAKVIGIKLDSDFSPFLNIEKEKKSEKHVPFTKNEINKLWNNRNYFVDIILFMLYSGIRPNELFKITEYNDNYFITGSKTEAGMNRKIPIHNDIKEIYKNIKYSIEKINKNSFYTIFKNELLNLDIHHYPYDTRHTFATFWKLSKADELARKKIMGHSEKDLTNNTYTHLNIDFLYDELNKVVFI